MLQIIGSQSDKAVAIDTRLRRTVTSDLYGRQSLHVLELEAAC